MNHKMTNVEALWPKLDKLYKFDPMQNRSVACETLTDPEGKYELNLIVTEAQAKELAGVMRKAFSEKRGDDWPDWSPKGLSDVFKQDEKAWIVKLTKKSYGEASSKPKQFMQDGSIAAQDFQLTTGSKVHVMIGVRPWKYAGKSGVTLRPEAVKVVELKERVESDPFSEADDPFADEASDPFGNPPPPKGGSMSGPVPDDEIPF